MSWSGHVYSLYTRTHIGRMIEAASLFKVSSKAEDCDVDACIVGQLFSSWSHLEMCSFSTWISLWKTMMKCRVRHVEKESIISIYHILSSSLVQLLIWSYLQFFSQDCCEITCPHPIFPYCSYNSYMFGFPIPTRLCKGAAFNCSIPGWAPNETKNTEIGQSAEDRKGYGKSWTLGAKAKIGSKGILGHATNWIIRVEFQWNFLPLEHHWDVLPLPTFTSSTWFAWYIVRVMQESVGCGFRCPAFRNERLNRSNKWRNYHICRRTSIRIHVRLLKAAASKVNLVQECCTPLCGNSAQVTCKAGFAVKEENVNKTSADIDEAAYAVAWCEMTPQFHPILLISFGSLLCLQSSVRADLTLEGQELSWCSNCFAWASLVCRSPLVCVYIYLGHGQTKRRPTQSG